MGEIDSWAGVPRSLLGCPDRAEPHFFAIGHETMPPALIRAFGVLKLASAQVNFDLGKLDADGRP
jgi:fumarate hydratase class II